MKNICFFTTDMSWSGGTNKCTSMIANELVKYKYNIFVVDLRNEENAIMYDLGSNIHYESLNAGSHMSIALTLRRYLKKHSIDLVVTVEDFLGIYSIPATIFTKTKVAIWEHGNYYTKRYRFVDQVRWLEFHLCDYFITLTAADMDEFAKHYKGRCKLMYIYNACETIGKSEHYDLNSKAIITVAINQPEKGLDMLPEVAKAVYGRHPDWKWNVYGAVGVDEKLDEIVRRKIQDYRLEEFLVFHGLKKDIERYYKESAILVMTSRREGLPMTLLEARGYGIPMVAFDIKTGPSEIIENDVNGYLVEPFDIDDMADKICELIENPHLRNKFSSMACNNIEKFALGNIIDKWNDVLESIG